jgi:hypothetical protein
VRDLREGGVISRESWKIQANNNWAQPAVNAKVEMVIAIQEETGPRLTTSGGGRNKIEKEEGNRQYNMCMKKEGKG